MLRTFNFAALIVIVGHAQAQDARYKNVSERIFDEARIVDSKSFSRSTLRSEFSHFESNACATKSVARLTLAPTQEDLGMATNATFLDLTPGVVRDLVSNWPSVFGQSRKIRTAQAFCFGGSETIAIRDRTEVDRIQVRGNHDSREWNLHGVQVMIIGFRHESPEVPIVLFVRVKTLPSLEVASGIRNELQDRTGVPTVVVLRTDPFFWSSNGPRTDFFEVPPASPPGVAFLDTPFVTCPPRGTNEGCRTEKPGRAR